MNRRAIIIACVLLALAGMAQAQNTTNLQLTVGPEAALTVTTGTTALATTGTNFTIPYTGTTNFTYQIRTSKTSGTGSITSKVTTDFGAYGRAFRRDPAHHRRCADLHLHSQRPGTACSAQTASYAAATSVALVRLRPPVPPRPATPDRWHGPSPTIRCMPPERTPRP